MQPRQLTGLLADWHDRPDDPSVAEAVARRVYDELRGMARRRLAANDSVGISPTELVHEAWMRLEASDAAFRDRYHFFRLAAMCMRQLLVDEARQRMAAKRGAGIRPVTLRHVSLNDERMNAEILDLDRALADLEADYPRQAEVVVLHFFGGLALADVGKLNGTSRATARRDWQFARACLLAALKEDADG